MCSRDPMTPMRMTVARDATRTAFRRPDSTRNVAPSYRDDAVSASSVGRVEVRRRTRDLGGHGRARGRRRVSDSASRHGRAAPGGGSGYESHPRCEQGTYPHPTHTLAVDSGVGQAQQEGRRSVQGVVEDRLEGVPESRIGDQLRGSPAGRPSSATGRCGRTGRTRPRGAGRGSGWPASGRSAHRSVRARRADGADS